MFEEGIQTYCIMKVLPLVITLSACVIAEFNSQSIFSTELQWCQVYDNVFDDYRRAVYQFAVDAYRNIGSKPNHHFVFSPISLWIILASIAEATDPYTKQTMFKFLRLPIDPCVRLKYYQLATSRLAIDQDVYISNIRVLVIDERIKINPAYYNFVNKYSLFNVITAPMHYDPQTTLEEIRKISAAKLPTIDLRGNSVILDAVDYNGLWSTAFEEAVIERSSFYSRTGQRIGAVDLMKIRRGVRRSFLRSLNMKTIEIPVGYNDRYRMVVGIILDDNIPRAVKVFKGTVIDEYLNSIQESVIPIDIAIPRFSLTSEHDIKAILEELGLKNLWNNPAVTRYLSYLIIFHKNLRIY